MKPFLKWAGNKYQIINRIREQLPPGKRLIEPFAGSAAVFLNTDYPAYLLCDNNQDLINLYRYLQKDGPRFIEYCKTYFVPENNNRERYYELRQEFNMTENRRKKAALFVYLNRHCYNGLCRYNSSGRFNTPFGRYRKPYFPEREMLFFWKKARRAVFLCLDFRESMAMAEPGDVVYCDPPYVPLSCTANFTSYSSEGFGPEEQRDLAREAERLAARGIPVLLSNHDTEFTRTVYASAQIISFGVQRSISCDGRNRGRAAEVLALFKAGGAGLPQAGGLS
ncbi:MAG TPA: Dam family site-specific DNA-(adenine-N6)-methyltransferase [Syntrophomonadaceae bacterium]|nr:Dam family site-specific DNA-(adenine-N6)-methyltransferase [Syntrophomonadaceae bacterium]